MATLIFANIGSSNGLSLPESILTHDQLESYY